MVLYSNNFVKPWMDYIKPEDMPTQINTYRLKKSLFRLFLNGGGGGIRTHGTRERSTVFKTAPINRSGTPPWV